MKERGGGWGGDREVDISDKKLNTRQTFEFSNPSFQPDVTFYILNYEAC